MKDPWSKIGVPWPAKVKQHNLCSLMTLSQVSIIWAACGFLPCPLIFSNSEFSFKQSSIFQKHELQSAFWKSASTGKKCPPETCIRPTEIFIAVKSYIQSLHKSPTSSRMKMPKDPTMGGEKKAKRSCEFWSSPARPERLLGQRDLLSRI